MIRRALLALPLAAPALARPVALPVALPVARPVAAPLVAPLVAPLAVPLAVPLVVPLVVPLALAPHLVPTPALAQPLRPDGLVLQGFAQRRWLGILVYDAALYLPMRVAQPAEAVGPALIVVRYHRRVSLEDVRRVWVASLPAMDPGFDAWLRAVSPEDEERHAFGPAGAALQGPARPPLALAASAFTTALRGSWLGPDAPAALRAAWFPGA